jgi:hypothetical protein
MADTYDNPFDEDEIRVDARVTSEEGTPWTVPGFIYQPFMRRLEDGVERVTPAGTPEWRVRLSFPAPGAYTVVVHAQDRRGQVSWDPVVLRAIPADVPGMVRRHPTEHRYLVTDRGEAFYLVGANVCWGGALGTHSYDRWLARYAESGCNFFRVWLSPMWTTFAMNTQDTGFDRIDLESAWRLDHVLQSAERLGMRAMICIDSFNILRRSERRYGQWEQSPYYRDKGGPLTEPSQYFTDQSMQAAYRNRLRYLVARYGYSPSVFAWEFWNEVDIIDDYDSGQVAAWHQTMARHLRALDPWRHLITTSFARPAGDPAVDGLPELDLVQTHHYGSKDMALELGKDRAEKAAARHKPHFTGEFGIVHSTRSGEIDPGGIHLHNGLYASVGQMQAGTPMLWWWDSYIDPFDLYRVFGAFSGWIEGFDFVAQHVRPVVASVSYIGAPHPRSPEDEVLTPEHGTWEPAPWNKPVTVRVNRDGEIEQEGVLARVMHGLVNHPELHNPATFQLEAPERTTFGVVCEGVSGHGGSRLQISLDGKLVLDEEFADSSPDTDTMTQYNGVYEVKVPKGHHTARIENVGRDWFTVSYRIPWLRAEPLLRVLGLQGDTMGVVWVQNRFHTWRNAVEPDYEPMPVDRARLCIDGWAAGEWLVETWDTVAGAVASSATVLVDENGRIELPLPPIAWDLAFRIRQQP